MEFAASVGCPQRPKRLAEQRLQIHLPRVDHVVDSVRMARMAGAPGSPSPDVVDQSVPSVRLLGEAAGTGKS